MAEPDAKVVEAIAFFEQMLQTMPGDRTSLEFLVVAYEQTGQDEKRRDCLIKLAHTLLNERDYDNAQVIAGYLSAYTDFPPARAAVQKVAAVIQDEILRGQYHSDISGSGGIPGADAPAFAPAFQDVGLEVHALSRAASAAEMDLVWLWKEREFLPKEICMDVLHVLTDRPVTDVPALISALVLLDEQHPELTDALMERMQRESEMPMIPIELFEVQRAAAAVLAPAYVHVRGVLPFALLGGDVLVAVLNPLNVALQDETAARAARPCHFFMAHPRTWQQAAAKITMTQ
ncbi:MAG: hypothetical protein GX565_11580 [Lentisphaerae bacterium]|nr:hypothetical protein [Lentisphaerota bacterium]